MRRRRRIALLAAATVTLLIAGCGAEDFPNDPRPPAPIELTAKVGPRQVLVAPTRTSDGAPIGAGLATFTISNQTNEEVALTFSGAAENTTDPVVARGVLNYKLDLVEGPYIVSADDPTIREAAFEVGPERPSAQNDLLLP